MLRLARNLLAEAEPRAVLDRALDALIELTGAERGLIAVFDDGGRPRFEAARNLEREDLDGPGFEVSRTLIETVRMTGEPAWRANALDDSALGARASVIRLRILSVICLPLHEPGRSGDGCFGVVYLDHRSLQGVFHEATVALATGFAELIGPAARAGSERERLRGEVRELRAALEGRSGRAEFDRIVTRDPATLRALEVAARVAPSSVPVLITGESGTGKELVARAVHAASRAGGEMIAVNCGALPPDLFEAELFGARRGAFTGAVRDIPGWFERSRGGTLFLDEIGELQPACQVKLLRVLESGEYSPLGDTRIRRSDARVIAATHRHLREAVAAGCFREDLYYRLAVVEVEIPPLRRRPGDVVLLAAHLLSVMERPDGRTASLTRRAEALLREHRWPGNVRELRNVLQRAVLLAPGPELRPEDLAPALGTGEAPAGGPGGKVLGDPERIGFQEAKARMVEDFERSYLAAALTATGGNIRAAARRSGVDYKNFYRKVKRYRIDPARFKESCG